MLVWLSFADLHKPLGQTFVGIVVVRLPDEFIPRPREAVEAAMDKADDLGILPGDQSCYSIEAQGLPDEAVPEELRNKLLNEQEIMLAGIGRKHKTAH